MRDRFTRLSGKYSVYFIRGIYEILGTYGVIKGANTFLCVTAENTEGVMEIVGYNFEKLAPSAVNRQPWRVVMKDGNFHFYKETMAGGKVSLDLQSLDVAIGACHFHLAAESGGLAGKFVKEKQEVKAPAGMEYMFTWKTE